LIAIGVSEYQRDELKLNYAAKDAEDVAALFSSLKGFERVHVKTLTDSDVTRQKILMLGEWLSKVDQQDTVVLYFAGHGVLDQKLQYWFAPVDFDPEQPEHYGVSWTDIERLMVQTTALNRLVMLDTCHAGDFSKHEVDTLSPKVKVGLLAAHRGASRIDEPGTLRHKQSQSPTAALLKSGSLSRLIDELFLDVRSGGVTVIGSSSGAEFSYESSQWKNGVFTFALREALGAFKADENQDRQITLNELKRYLEHRVVSLTNGGQRPVMRRENLHLNHLVLTSKATEDSADSGLGK